MPKQLINSAAAPTTGFTDATKPAPIAQAIRFGNMLFVSGQGPLDPVTKTVVAGDIEVQTRQTLTNLINVQHAVFGTFGLFAGVVRWLSLRGLFPLAVARPLWPALVIALGVYLAFCYREDV